MDQATDNHIIKNTDSNSPLNYEALREKAIALVQAYSGNAWTDYNLHDPGVTILEHLCYAITDLAYRTQFDIRDLLSDEFGRVNVGRNLFYSRNEILSSTPVTVNDLRKLVLDNVQEVYNVWFEKIYSEQQAAYIKGLYHVVIQLFDANDPLNGTESEEEEPVNKHADILKQVRKVVLANRNLGEDYTGFSILKPCVIEVEADIVIDRHASGEEILAEVYMAMTGALNPVIQFYSEADMLGKGYTLEEMYSGPALQHGFLIDKELDSRVQLMDAASLAKSTRYRIIDPSDILRSLGSIPGILYVRDFKVKANGQYRESPFELADDEYAYFSYEKEERDIRIFNEQNEMPIKESLFFSHLHKRQDLSQRKFIKDLHQSDETAELRGEYRRPGEYFSFQHLFPPVYRLNMDEVESPLPAWKQSDEESVMTKAKTKQLKAYLVLFEQLLANYLAQLAGLDRILTADMDDDSTTYFSQPLYGVPGVANILKDFHEEEAEHTGIFWEQFKARSDNGYRRFLQSHAETDDAFHNRKNRVLDHLMSRFNLNLKKYPVVFFNQLYHPEDVDAKLSSELLWKSGLLKDIVSIGRNRNQAWDYNADGLAASGGFEELMCRLLYIQYLRQRMLSEIADKYLGRFSVKDRIYSEERPPRVMATIPLEWGKGTRMELLISEEEIAESLQGEKAGDTTEKNNDLSFSGQPISFLKDALDNRNFRIGPDIGNSGYALIYKAPSHTKWIRAGRFADWPSANNALVSLQTTLRDFNIESEGFHVVEHILLRPAIDRKFFGFRFYDEKGHVLLYQNHWMDYAEREALLAKIMQAGDEQNPLTDAQMAELLNYQCLINQWSNDKLVKSYHAHALLQSDPQLAARLFERIRRNIRGLRKKKRVLYPGIENTVRRVYSDDLREDFFQFRITVVFPSWPARFQDRGFRTFAENLFREQTPAHLKLEFRWLGVEPMREFEKLYFDWRESMSGENRTDNDMVRADKLLSFLNDGSYSVTGHFETKR
jgi:hypothetical protein